MNSKMIIGALVGGLLIFIWQFLSWSMLNLHGSNQQYTPNQDAILECLSTNLPEGGSYFMPNVPPGTPTEDHQKIMESSIGKPWAIVSYHKSFNMSMGMNMTRGFLADVVAVFLLCWLLGQMTSVSMQKSIMLSIAVGMIGYLTTSYTNAVWFEVNSMPELIDALVSWGLCGAWLGFWLKR
ncbi:MAG: hypothetical protein WBO36_07340 [Saprospiraceae bacterium]